MSGPDVAARGALDADVRRVATFCFLDIAGEPVRVTDAPYPVTFAGTGDEDLDGFTFDPVNPDVVTVTPVKNKTGGSDSVTLTLSGLVGVDDELLDAIAVRANYQGRDARLWKMMLDPETLAPIGAVWPYFTGYMSVPKIVGDRASQTVQMTVETYLAFFGQASNRTYLDQADFDPGDKSAELSIAIANGASKRS